MVVRRLDPQVVNTPHRRSPDFQKLSFDWSVEKCNCQINAVGRYILISKMNFFIFSHIVLFRGSYFLKAIEKVFPVFA